MGESGCHETKTTELDCLPKEVMAPLEALREYLQMSCSDGRMSTD